IPNGEGRLKYYTAIRVPQSLENLRLQRLVKRGLFRAEELVELETNALKALRAFDRRGVGLEETLRAVMAYNAILTMERPYDEVRDHPSIRALCDAYRRTLSDRPWQICKCPICGSSSIEVILFRASNRNKRRGIHNLRIYKQLVASLNDRK